MTTVMSENLPKVESPCVRNCCLNDADVCLGCFRSLSEIRHWTQVDDATRKQFLQNAALRREQQRNSISHLS